MRTVRTLLLCRVNPSSNQAYTGVYKNMYAGKNEDGKKYISLGNVDSFSIYNPLAETDSSSNWFKELYEDRKEIIWHTKVDRSYHPIHMVANRVYNDAAAKHNPFCIVTLLYGLKREGSTSNFSFYEYQIEQVIKNMKPDPQKETNTEFPDYEIYNAVNICDAVIVWYADDLLDTLRYVNQFGLNGHARKSFTLIGFSMGDDGRISEDAITAIESPKNQATYYARIQGSIHDPKKYSKIKEEIQRLIKTDPAQNAEDYNVFGQSDFIINLSNWNGKSFSSLLQYYIRNSDTITAACWEIHTELMSRATEGQSASSEPRNVLGTLLEKYEKIKDKQDVQALSWFAALYELLCIHVNIDRHPILHGPAYLFYDFLEITGHYLSSDTTEKRKVIERSENELQQVVQAWSTLTDQLLRIDDFTFHGFGNGSVLYNTLPECALDFYHAFLQNFVDLLVTIDHNAKRAEDPDLYYHDFIMLPELKKKVSIIPVLDVDNHPRGNHEAYRQLSPKEQVFIVYFPVEKVFSPLDYFAKLIHECFHHFGEAFRLRKKRTEYVCRFFASYMMLYASGNWDIPFTQKKSPSGTLLNEEGLSEFYYSCLREVFEEDGNEAELYFDEIIENLTTGTNNIQNEENQRCVAYLKTEQILADFIAVNPKWSLVSQEGTRLKNSIFKLVLDHNGNIDYLFSDAGLEDLAFETRLQKTELEKAWKQSKEKRQDTKKPSPGMPLERMLERCEEYFKECYADLMMLLTLQLKPETYLTLFDDIMANANQKLREAIETEDESAIQIAAMNITQNSQRIAFTLAAYDPQFAANIQNQNYILTSLIAESIKKGIKTELDLCDKRLTAFEPFDQELAQEEIRIRLFPTKAWKAVVDYLSDVVNEFQSFEKGKTEAAQKLSEFRKDFQNVFCNGEFLSKRYFEIISDYHELFPKQTEHTAP